MGVPILTGLIKPALMRNKTPKRPPPGTMGFCYQRVCVPCMMESGLRPGRFFMRLSVPELSPEPRRATHVCDSHLGDHLGKWAPISSG